MSTAFRPSIAFCPQRQGGTSMAVASGSTRIRLDSWTGAIPMNLRLRTKATDADCFIEFGTDNTLVAVASSGMALAGGSTEFIRVPATCTWIAAITASGTATLYLHAGEGS